MSQQYDNTNRFALFPNKDRKTDKHPNLSGTLNIDGVEYFIDGWTKQSQRDGSKFISGTAKRKDKQPAQGGGQSYGGNDAPPAPDLDDDIPF